MSSPQVTSEAEQDFEAAIDAFSQIHYGVISKMQSGHGPSPEELAEALLGYRALYERIKLRREASTRAAKELMDAIDLEP